MDGTRRALLAVAAVAAALRLAAGWTQAGAVLDGDAGEYTAIASNLASRAEYSVVPGVPTARRPPLYPLFLTPFAALTPGSWGLARAGQALLDSTTPFFLYGIGMLAFRRKREALAGAAVYACHPVFAAYAGRMLTETLFFWVWAAAMWLLLKALDGGDTEGASTGRRPGEGGACAPAGGYAWAAAAGAALAAATLCRPMAIVFPLFSAGALIVLHRGLPGARGRLFILVAAAYALLLPWAGRNRAVVGKWVPAATGGGLAMWIGTQTGAYPDLHSKFREVEKGRSDIEIDQEFYRLARSEASGRLGRILADLPRRTAHFWLTSHSSILGVDRPVSEYRSRGLWLPIAFRAALWGLQLATLLAGAWGLWLRRKEWTPGCTLLAVVFVYYTLHVLTDYGPNRYHLPALMLWLLPAAAAGSHLADRLRGRRQGASAAAGG